MATNNNALLTMICVLDRKHSDLDNKLQQNAISSQYEMIANLLCRSLHQITNQNIGILSLWAVDDALGRLIIHHLKALMPA